MEKVRFKKAIFTVFMFCALLWVGGFTSYASTEQILTKIDKLKTKFPDGRYWNHAGMTHENVDGWTTTPCPKELHADKTHNIHINGTNGCVCNHFVNAKHGGRSTQCMGFAYKLGYDVFGDVSWTSYTDAQKAYVSVGDILRIGTHSVFVVERSGSVVTVAECNWSGRCMISWGRKIDLAKTTLSYWERANNYTSDIGENLTVASTNSEQEEYTGWLMSEDGRHKMYMVKGKTLKRAFHEENGAYYFFDENGYMVTGPYKFYGKIYGFNDNGVFVKKRWFESKGKLYYAGLNGVVWTKKWVTIGSRKYYLAEDGHVAVSEFVKIGSNFYYFRSNGLRSAGFIPYGKAYFYCNANGVLRRNCWLSAGGKKYYVMNNYLVAMNRDVVIGGKKYHFDENGVMTGNVK